MDRLKYERELAARQRKHLDNLEAQNAARWKPCLHDLCPMCHGTGRSQSGYCIHGISCDCPKCAAR